MLKEALSFFEASGDEVAATNVLADLARILADRGEYEQAVTWFRQNLARQRNVNNGEGVAIELCNLGQVARLQGDGQRARALYEEALDVARAQGYRSIAASAALSLGEILVDVRDADGATQLLREALMLGRASGAREYMAEALDGLARTAASQARARRAVTLAGAATRTRFPENTLASTDVQRPPGEYLTECWQTLGVDAAERAVAEGRLMTEEQAIRYALRDDP